MAESGFLYVQQVLSYLHSI